MRQLYRAAQVGVDEVEKLVDAYPEYANLAKLTPDGYEQAIREEEQSKSLRRAGLMAGGIILALAVVALLVRFVVMVPGLKAAQADLQAAQTQAAVNNAVLVQMQQTIAAQATSLAQTPTPTEIGPTPEPTENPAAPQVYLPSRFNISPYSNLDIKPALPFAPHAIWLMDAASAELNPAEGWKDATDTATKSKFKYIANVNASASWVLDQPLNQGGWYALFLTDTAQNSADTVQVNLLANGQTVSSVLGAGQVVMNSSKSALPQKDSEWLLAGIYPFNPGDSLEIELRQDGEGQEWTFGVDRALLLKLSDSDQAVLTAAQSEGRPVVGLADDSAAIYEISVGGVFSSTKEDWLTTPSLAAFNGSLHQPASDFANDVRVTWGFPGLLPAGKYEVLAWIPAEHATAAVTYSLLANGKTLAGDSPTNGQITQNNEGQWVQLGLWQVADDNASLSVQMLVAKGAPGEAAADAIVLRKAD